MSTTTAPLTVDQYLALPKRDDVRQELIGGELITMGRGGQVHEIVKANFNRELGAYMARNRIGYAMSETTFRLTSQDAPMPDAAVVLAGRLVTGHTGLIPICPDIVIEVVSSESAAFLQAKVKLYLQHGAKAVWIAYPQLRIIHVHTATGVRELSGDQSLEAPDVLPGFRVAVAELFDGV